MATRSHDAHPRGTIVRDRDGDQWRKGTAWWHWTGRRADTGPGKLLWQDLEERYGPLAVTATVSPVAPRPRGSIPRDYEARLAAAKEERDRADAQLKKAEWCLAVDCPSFGDPALGGYCGPHAEW